MIDSWKLNDPSGISDADWSQSYAHTHTNKQRFDCEMIFNANACSHIHSTHIVIGLFCWAHGLDRDQKYLPPFNLNSQNQQMKTNESICMHARTHKSDQNKLNLI